jgi:hypothetical protein
VTDLFLGKKPSLERSRFILYDVEISGNIQIILKLVIIKSDNKVLYAQVGFFGEWKEWSIKFIKK